MIRPLLGILAIFVIIVSGELLWRARILRDEWSRKFVHISVGSFVAFWPFFTTFHWVQVLAAAFLAVILVSLQLHIFKGIHSVKRKTLGELFYPLGIGVASLLTTNKYIFAAAILHLSLADGLAAIIGIKYGKKHQYHVGKLTKSYIGTLTFVLVSAAISYWSLRGAFGLQATAMPFLFVIPVIVAFVESVAPNGSDNFFIPLSVVGLMSLASLMA